MVPITMPDLYAFEDPVITRWLVAEGDVVDQGDDVVAVGPDKAEALVTAPHAGRITRICAAVGDHPTAGDVLGEIS